MDRKEALLYLDFTVPDRINKEKRAIFFVCFFLSLCQRIDEDILEKEKRLLR